MDVDADGRKDLVGFDPVPGSTTSAVARGLGARAFAYRNYGLVTAVPVLDGSLPIFADLDGDGDADAFSFSLYGNLHTVLENRATVATGCSGGGGVPGFSIGVPWWGNPSFTLGLSGAAPNAPALLAVSTVSTAGAGCGPGLSVLPANLLLPSGPVGLFTTSVAGAAGLTTVLPAVPALSGLRVFAQWAVSDPAGSYPAGGSTFALTPMRTICVF